MNPNTPHYNSITSNTNLNLLDNMLMAAGFPGASSSDVPKAVLPQYTYTDMTLTSHHHAMNLATSQSNTGVQSIPILLYPQHQSQPTTVTLEQHHQFSNHHSLQQQPISYKIPQQIDDIGDNFSSAIKKKDIVAEAMRSTEKIFEDLDVKKQLSVSEISAIKSEPPYIDTKAILATKSIPDIKVPMLNSKLGSKRRGGGRLGSQAGNRQHNVLPRLSLLEEEDDGLTCRLCLQSFWYKTSLLDHYKNIHSISDPHRYEREEREKKMKRLREEQQKIAVIKRQQELRAFKRGGGGRGRAGTIRLTSPGCKASSTGPRPSFQYRDGAFICDLCKKSFSDGNDMVTHWKSHVKKISSPMTTGGGRRRGGGGGGTNTTTSNTTKTGKNHRRDKGRPRWTAYLVWSTRRRKEICIENNEWTFAEVSKKISEEWKKVESDVKEKLQDEADEMNATGQRKLPKEPQESSTTEDSDESSIESDFDENELAKKPIMLKIKKESLEAGEDGRPRSGRQRKRPSFFQEFENEENNLDKILDDFELEQIEEAKKPKEKKEKPPKPSGGVAKKRRKIRTPSPQPEPVELETSRSGRIRKKIKFFDKLPDLDEPGDVLEDVENEEDRDEYHPEEEEEVEEPEEEFVDEDLEVEDEGDSNLPPKKRGRKSTKVNVEDVTKKDSQVSSFGDEGLDDPSLLFNKEKHNWITEDGSEIKTESVDAKLSPKMNNIFHEIVLTNPMVAIEDESRLVSTVLEESIDKSNSDEHNFIDLQCVTSNDKSSELSTTSPTTNSDFPPVVDDLLRPAHNINDDDKYKDLIAETQIDNIFN